MPQRSRTSTPGHPQLKLCMHAIYCMLQGIRILSTFLIGTAQKFSSRCIRRMCTQASRAGADAVCAGEHLYLTDGSCLTCVLAQLYPVPLDIYVTQGPSYVPKMWATVGFEVLPCSIKRLQGEPLKDITCAELPSDPTRIPAPQVRMCRLHLSLVQNSNQMCAWV